MYVITGSGTCSASESVINSLRGVGVTVYQIGSTTCGKPYGFYPTDNCGTTYFSIQFRGENAANFGDYTDGFSPANTSATTGTSVPGCSVADDFTHAMGDAAGAAAPRRRWRFRAGNNSAAACPAASGLLRSAAHEGIVPDCSRPQPVGLEAGGTHESHHAQKLKADVGAFPDAPEWFLEKGASAPFSFSA